MVNQTVYDVFISYNSRDKSWVREFASLLKSCGVATFFDESNIEPGGNVSIRVADGVKASRRMLVMLSGKSVSSKWLEAEFSQKLMDDPAGTRGSVIPVVLDEFGRGGMPEVLKKFGYVDFADIESRQNEFVRLLKQLGVKARAYPVLPEYPRTKQHLLPAKKASFRRGRNIEQGSNLVQKKIAILGVGYVGSALAAAFLEGGHKVLGIDSNLLKVDALNRGRSHLYEPGIDGAFEKAYENKTLAADAALPSQRSDISVIVVSVGPSLNDGDHVKKWDVDRFFNLLQEVGQTIRAWRTPTPVPVVITATLRPEDCKKAISTLETHTGAREGKWFELAVCPLFLREGAMLSDLHNPPFIVLGSATAQHNTATTLFASLLSGLTSAHARSPRAAILLSMEAACLLKLASNAFHAMKVAFANEVSRICLANDVSPTEVMNAFACDQILNISNAYLRPGLAFGGSCLQKDLLGLLSALGTPAVSQLTLLSAIQTSNEVHLHSCIQKIERVLSSRRAKKVGVFGITFKPGTDDMRDSPSLAIIKALTWRAEVMAIDLDLLMTDNLTGGNRRYWQRVLEECNVQLILNPIDIVRACEVLVISKLKSFPYEKIISELNSEHVVIDLVGEIDPGMYEPLPCKWERLA